MYLCAYLRTVYFSFPQLVAIVERGGAPPLLHTTRWVLMQNDSTRRWFPLRKKSDVICISYKIFSLTISSLEPLGLPRCIFFLKTAAMIPTIKNTAQTEIIGTTVTVKSGGDLTA